jgi:NAD(P)H-flavin reductase
MALTSPEIVGKTVRLGPPVGVLTLDKPGANRNLLLVAGSTGLAPLKAILEQVTGWPRAPQVQLFFGARTADDLYDLENLEKMAAEHPWLTVTPVVSADPAFPGETGNLPDVVGRQGDWSDYDAYLAGPTGMVRDTASTLTAAGLAKDHIHIEDFGWSES